MNYYDLTLDVASQQTQGVLEAKYGDTARAIRFFFRENGSPWYGGSSLQVIFTAIKADGKILYNACRQENGAWIYDFTPQTAACPGLMRCEMRILERDKLLTSPRFDIQVSDTLYHDGDAVDSTSEATALKTVGNEMTALMQSIRQSLDQGAFQGEKGEAGQDGLTPHIGENGNWYLGSQDTGVYARGEGWEKLTSFSLAREDACHIVTIDRDDQGLPFRCQKLLLKARTASPTSTSFAGWVEINGNGSYNSGALGFQLSYVSYAAYARMQNDILYEKKACAVLYGSSSVLRLLGTELQDFHQIQLSGYGSEENVFFGEFELWGVRA